MKLTKTIFSYDAPHSRYDTGQLFTHGLTVAIALIWGFMTAWHAADVLILSAQALLLLVIIRVTLARLGAGRISSLVVATLSLVWLTDLESVEVAAFLGCLMTILLLVEYFRSPTKLRALSTGVLVGLLAALLQYKSLLILTLFIGAIAARILWHAFLERPSKRQFILLIIKAAGTMAVSVIMYLLVKPYIGLPNLGGLTPLPSVPLFMGIAVAALAIIGLWVTILIRTQRSPRMRSVRLYVVFYGLMSAVMITALNAAADDIFLPSVIAYLDDTGLNRISIESLCFAWFSVATLVSAAIDRFFFKDTVEARRLYAQSLVKE